MLENTDSHQLLELYRAHVRSFLAENAAGDLTPLDQVAELLERALGQSDILSVGFVGESQVGKSTLINALLERRALPEGGVGPLTAQATRVSYAQENSLSVTYHGRKQLNQLVFSIAAHLHRKGEIDKPGPLPEDIDPSAVEAFSDESLEESGEERRAEYRSDKGDYMLMQAKRILTLANAATEGHSTTNVELLDALRATVGEARQGADGLQPYGERIAEIQALLGSSERLAESQVSANGNFNKALRERATGWRSPLVERLDVHLSASNIEGVTLVDLPGIGVLNDSAGQEAEKFVRKEGDALVIVFRNSGITDNIAALLERTGVITKLLFGGRDNVPPIEVTLVVTHIDDVAKTRYRIARQEATDSEVRPPTKGEVFRQVAGEMEQRLRGMLHGALCSSPAFDGLSDGERQARERVVTLLCERMQVVCVAAPDFLALVEGDDDNGAFLRDPEDTGIPRLRAHLQQLVRTSGERRQRTIVQFDTSLRESIRERLAALVHMYQEGRGIAIQDWERFRDELTKAAEPLRREMHAYHGEAVGILRDGIRGEIAIICKDAEISGSKKLQRLSREGQTKHFMSLRAALMRNGVWDRRDINYPEAITLSMVDSIASQWDPKVIERVRAVVKGLAERDARLLEKLCIAAKAAGGKLVIDEILENQQKILQSSARTAVAWTKEQLETLRENVRQSLREAVSKPIERACDKAIKQGDQRGTGAKIRILSTFEEGGEAAVTQARDAAERILRAEYSALLQKLDKGFLRENHDPIQSAVDMLSGQQVDRARRSDAQRKRTIVNRADEIARRLGPVRESKSGRSGDGGWDFARA